MFRRCAALESCPGFYYNQGAVHYTDNEGTKLANVRHLARTMLESFKKEVNSSLNLQGVAQWDLQLDTQIAIKIGAVGDSELRVLFLGAEATWDRREMDTWKQMKFMVPTSEQLLQRTILDRYLADVMGLTLSKQEKRLSSIDELDYVLTLDYAVKMINIHERRLARVPLIIQGETGVGKTMLIRMLARLWNDRVLGGVGNPSSQIARAFLTVARQQLGEQVAGRLRDAEIPFNAVALERIAGEYNVTAVELETNVEWQHLCVPDILTEVEAAVLSGADTIPPLATRLPLIPEGESKERSEAQTNRLLSLAGLAENNEATETFLDSLAAWTCPHCQHDNIDTIFAESGVLQTHCEVCDTANPHADTTNDLVRCVVAKLKHNIQNHLPLYHYPGSRGEASGRIPEPGTPSSQMLLFQHYQESGHAGGESKHGAERDRTSHRSHTLVPASYGNGDKFRCRST